jgi:hypothetical protein
MSKGARLRADVLKHGLACAMGASIVRVRVGFGGEIPQSARFHLKARYAAPATSRSQAE